MNYLWEVALKADEAGIKRETLKFIPAKICSPYMEAAFEDLNLKSLADNEIEVNPLYRFSKIFSRILDVNLAEYSKTRELLFDICMQYMVQLDLRQGLNRDEYYLRFILKDILTGLYGEQAQKAIALFTHIEQHRILEAILQIYKAGISFRTFDKLMHYLYPSAFVYSRNDSHCEVLIYLGCKENDRDRAKIQFLQDIFIDKKYVVQLFWENHFGILDIEPTMQVDKIELY